MSKLTRSGLVLVLALVGCMSVAAVAGAADGDRASILVKVEPGADPDAVAARNEMSVVRYLPEIHWAEMVPLASGETGPAQTRKLGSGAAVVTEASPRQLRELGEEVGGDPAVRAVEVVPGDTGLEWQAIPSDPVFQPHLKLPPESAPWEPQAAWHLTLPNFPGAWDSTTGAGILVAVVDGEFDTNNPDLGAKLVNRYNAVSGSPEYRTPNILPKAGDQAHGTHVAGLIGAATNNGLAVAGSCFECDVMAIKVSFAPGAQTVADVAEGILYAANGGARVLNLSLGGPQPFQPQADAIAYAVSKGVVVVASGGNSQEESPGLINYPSAYPNVIGVGATDSKDLINSASTNGSWIDVSAPGKEVLSTTSAIDENWAEFNSGPGLPPVLVSVKDGTSMAAPIVAGLAGLMLSVRPDLTPAEVEALIKATSRDLGAPGPDVAYGAGRIDAAAAVAAARAYVRPPVLPPTPPERFRKIGTKVSLRVKLSKGKVSYLGSISSKNKKCLKKRDVSLRAKRSNKALVQTKTTKRGGFKLSLPKRPKKRVQVVIKAKKVSPTAVCMGAKSKFVN